MFSKSFKLKHVTVFTLYNSLRAQDLHAVRTLLPFVRLAVHALDNQTVSLDYSLPTVYPSWTF